MTFEDFDSDDNNNDDDDDDDEYDGLGKKVSEGKAEAMDEYGFEFLTDLISYSNTMDAHLDPSADSAIVHANLMPISTILNKISKRKPKQLSQAELLHLLK